MSALPKSPVIQKDGFNMDLQLIRCSSYTNTENIMADDDCRTEHFLCLQLHPQASKRRDWRH